ATAARLERLSPGHRVGGMRQDLDRRADLLRHALLLEITAKRRRLDAARGGLREHQPAHRLTAARASIGRYGERPVAAGHRQAEPRRGALEARGTLLHPPAPPRTLARG